MAKRLPILWHNLLERAGIQPLSFKENGVHKVFRDKIAEKIYADKELRLMIGVAEKKPHWFWNGTTKAVIGVLIATFFMASFVVILPLLGPKEISHLNEAFVGVFTLVATLSVKKLFG